MDHTLGNKTTVVQQPFRPNSFGGNAFDERLWIASLRALFDNWRCQPSLNVLLLRSESWDQGSEFRETYVVIHIRTHPSEQAATAQTL